MKFRKLLEKAFITRAVNDTIDKLKEMFPEYKVKHINFNDYDIKDTKFTDLEVSGWKVKYVKTKQKEVLFDLF